MENHYKQLYQKIAIIASIVSILFLLLVIAGDSFVSEWTGYQKEFRKISLSKAKTEQQKEAVKNFRIEIKQIILEDFETVDRCITCHNGLEDSNMADQQEPHKNHSGSYLVNHPMEKFGCTICHGGQGRGLTMKEAFGREKGLHWETPLLPVENTQASCGKCHLSVFDKRDILDGAGILTRGRDLFFDNRCISCHKVRNTGGNVGPELTSQGTKAKHGYQFSGVQGEHTVKNWLKEHFIDPQSVSPGSTMPAVNLNDSDMNALVTFVMGLYPADFDIKYLSLKTINEFKGERVSFEGEKGYRLYCSNCHGDDGKGKDYRVFKASVPALNSENFLSLASRDMILFTITNGRSGRPMAKWGEGGGNLSKKEINSILDYITGWKTAPPSFNSVVSSRGDISAGETLFRSRCGTCHGSRGEGAIGPKLNSQNFLSIASKRYLYDTIVRGRANTAMPSWYYLKSDEIAGLIAYIKNWQKVPDINTLRSRISGDIESGSEMFRTMCTQCHGIHGQGSVGPALLNRDFLSVVPDEFIYRSISYGREGSAMQGWINSSQGYAQLKSARINDIVAYIRSRENARDKYIYSNIVAGSPTKGMVLFNGMCASCHGWKGEGIHGPALNNQEFLNSATNGFLQGTIAQGRSGTAMRSWAKGGQGYEELGEIEINDIISYIRTWQKRKMLKIPRME